MNIKDITIPLIIHIIYWEHSEHYTNLSTLNHNVRFLPCQHRGVGIMQYVYALNPCVHRFNYSCGHPAEKFPVRSDIVNPGIQWRFIALWHTLININNMWNFNSLFRVCLIFYTHDSLRTSKSIGNNTMKMLLSHCAGPAYYRMCSTDVYCSKQTGSSSTKGKPSPIISSFLELGRKKNCRCSQNLWRRRKCC